MDGEFLERKCRSCEDLFFGVSDPLMSRFSGKKKPAKIESFFFAWKKDDAFQKRYVSMSNVLYSGTWCSIEKTWWETSSNFPTSNCRLQSSNFDIADFLLGAAGLAEWRRLGLRPWRLVTTAKQLGNFLSPHYLSWPWKKCHFSSPNQNRPANDLCFAPWKWRVAIFPASAMRLCFMCTTAEQGSNSNGDRRESPSIMTATHLLEPFLGHVS